MFFHMVSQLENGKTMPTHWGFILKRETMWKINTRAKNIDKPTDTAVCCKHKIQN